MLNSRLNLFRKIHAKIFGNSFDLTCLFCQCLLKKRMLRNCRVSRDNNNNTYKPKPGAKRRNKVDEKTLKKTVDYVRNKQKSVRDAGRNTMCRKVFYIDIWEADFRCHPEDSRRWLQRWKRFWRITFWYAVWGYPLNAFDFRVIDKDFLDRKKIEVKVFNDNMRGPDFVEGFLKRHNVQLTLRMCQNIKRNRAAVYATTIHSVFDNDVTIGPILINFPHIFQLLSYFTPF